MSMNKGFKEFLPSSWAIDHSTVVYVLISIFFILGFSSYISLPRENFPEINSNVIFVSSVYPGNTAEDVERLITDPLEEELKGVSNLVGIKSTSQENISLITIEFDENILKEKAKNDVQDKVDAVTAQADWPIFNGAKIEPSVFEYSISEEVPILNIGLSGNIPRKEMKIYGEVLKDKIEQMAEIKEVSLRGVQDFEVEVSLDLIKMVAATVSFDDVINCIQRGNNTISAGNIEGNGLRRNIRVIGEIKNPEDLENFVVKNQDGTVFLGDISKITFKEKEIKEKLLSGSYPARSPLTNIADLKAQIAACKKGETELLKIVDKYGLRTVFRFQELVCQNAENAVRESIKTIKSTEITYQMDNDLSGAERKVHIKLTPKEENSSIEVDFNGTTMQLESNYNAPLPVTRAAVLYAFRILTGGNIPMNSGIMKPIKIKIPKGSMLSPEYPAAVIAGNVETSQAVTSALLMGFGLQAASQSTMNNITWGNDRFQYYETICGGTGAGIDFSGSFYEGTSAVHSHMTNSRLTDPETLEFRYPVILEEFSIRRGSGGIGQYHGGDGVIRKISFLEPMIISVLSGHRSIGPPGLLGGGSGKVGSTSLLRNSGIVEILKYADQIEGKKGDILVVKTPGGGALGTPTK